MNKQNTFKMDDKNIVTKSDLVRAWLLRNRKLLNLAHMCFLVGMSRNDMNKFERGKHEISERMAIKWLAVIEELGKADKPIIERPKNDLFITSSDDEPI